jgi:hypothetical protein
MKLGQTFREAAARLLPPKTEKVVLNLQDVARALELTHSRYRNAPELSGVAHNIVGMYPGVRNPVGNTRAWYADPQQTITVKPAPSEWADSPQEQAWPLKSSAAIFANDYLISRWNRGFNLVLRNKIKGPYDLGVIFAMHGKYDKNDNLTVKKLYLPVFNGAKQMTGYERVAVTLENVTKAMEYMALCKDQMAVDGGIYLNPRENLIQAFGTVPTRPGKDPAPKPR